MIEPTFKDIDFVELINADANVGVMIVSADGHLVWYSRNVPKIFGASPDHDYSGKRIDEIFHEEFANERIEWIRQVISDGQTMRVSHLYQGDQMISTIMPLERDTVSTYASILTRRERLRDDNSANVTKSQLVDLGPLSTLSGRELEVLILLGHGHSVPETAKLLHRSPRTIEQHKASIGRKLGTSVIADIARRVGEVGLQMNDLGRQKFTALREEFRKP